MPRDFFIPADFSEPMTQLQQYESYAQSGLIYESAQFSAEWLNLFLEKFRRPAFGFGQGSKAWQRRAIKAWYRVAQEWQAMKFPGAKKILDALAAATGLHQKMLKAALYNHFSVFNETVLNEWLRDVKRERDRDAERKTKYPALAFVVAAGNIPGVAIHPVVHLSLLGIPALVKNASREPFLLPAILTTLAKHDAEVASRLAALTWPRSASELTEAVLKFNPALAAFGDEVTMSRFAQRKKSFADFGDRFSLTVVNSNRTTAKVCGLAYDTCMFEQMGCLSPQAIILLTNDWKKVESFCQHFAKAMANMNKMIPVGKRSTAQHALIQQWRGALAVRGAAGEKIILLTGAGTDWTVAAAEKFDLNERVAYRFARVWPVASIEEFVSIVHQYRDKLHVLIWGNSGTELEKFFDTLQADDTFDNIFFALAGFAQRPDCGWLDEVNPSWRRLMRGLRQENVKPINKIS